MRTPRGLTVKYDCVKDGKLYYEITATSFYLFKTLLKIGYQNRGKPLLACLIFGYALYYLMSRGL